jgi:MFS family permease
MFKKNALMIQIMIVFFMMFVGLYIPFTQRVPYLTSIGYSNTDMNIIFSIQAAVAFIYQLVFGFLCDKYRTIKKFFIAAVIIGTIGTFLMFQITTDIFFFHILTMAVMGSFLNLATGLLDSWALEIDPSIQRNYGAVRAMGTVGWIVGGYFVTLVFEAFGYKSLGLTFTIISIVVLLLTLRLKDAVKEHHATPLRIKDMRELLFSKRYMVIVLVLLFGMMLATSDGILVVMKMEVLNATAFEKYFRFASQAFVELPLFFFGAKLLERFNPVKLLGFAIFMFGVRYVGYSLAPTPTWMIIVALLQAVTFPILMVASKQLIFRESPTHLRSSGQLFALSIYNGIGASLIPLITTFLIDRGGIDFALMALAAMMVIPLTLVFYFLKLEKN